MAMCAGLRHMQKDARWSRGRVVESVALLGRDKRDPYRDVKLMKIDMLEGHGSYEPGACPSPVRHVCFCSIDIALHLSSHLGK